MKIFGFQISEQLKKSLPHKIVKNGKVNLDQEPDLQAPTSIIMDNIVELAYMIKGSNRKCLRQGIVY
jgi:hypothetical protein